MRELERTPTDIHAPAQALPPIAVVGAGRLGGSILAAAGEAGLDARAAGRDDLASSCAGVEVALLCVPDGEIASAAHALAAQAPHLRFVGHTSGATGLDALGPARAAGAATFSLHPLQTFAGAGSSPTAGAPAAVAADGPQGLTLARALATELGMPPFELREDLRTTYHAAAAIASNFLITLEESAARLLARCGVEPARELLAPLVLRSAANWAELGPDALTGPIARGDTGTVERHLQALREGAPELVPLYEALAAQTRALAAGEDER